MKTFGAVVLIGAVVGLAAGARGGGFMYDEALVPRFNIPRTSAPPVIDGRIIYAQAEKTNAYQLKADGDAVSLELLWESTGSRGRRTPSPVLHDGLLYGVTTEGILDVTDAKTGEAVYRERLDLGRNIYASVTSAGGYLFIVSTDGATLVFKPGRQFTEIARNMLESLGTCPVFAGNRLYLRGQQHLYCIEEQ